MISSSTLALAGLALPGCAKKAAGKKPTVSAERVPLRVSHLGGPNPLPQFRAHPLSSAKLQKPAANLTAAEAEEVKGKTDWNVLSVFPYQVQDDYDRSQAPGHLDVVAYDNGRLRALIAPRLGGRLLSLVDLSTGRELLFRNPVFQPANLASLNAWFSGGIEWNGLIPGHSPFTCSPVFCGVVETDRGPILRLYEFDRIREGSWQVDLFLPEGDDRLFVHGRIVNPNTEERPFYWWTNTAVAFVPGLRVLAPAEYSMDHEANFDASGRPIHFPFPNMEGFSRDASYPGSWPHSRSLFFRKPGADRLWLMALMPNGQGLMQTSTSEMRGRKMWYWGNSPGGQHWMDFLSLPGRGRYVEIQSGIAPSQAQDFRIAAGGSLEWTECFAPIALDAKAAHDPDFNKACAVARKALDARVPTAELGDHDAWLRTQASRPLSRRLNAGTRWGELHQVLSGKPVAAGLDFAVDGGAERPWEELARTGRFSEETLEGLPESWVGGDRWRVTLLKSAETQGETWLHELALGVIAIDREAHDEATAYLSRSLDKRQTYLALRHLALLADTPAEAERLYLRAWDTGQAPARLAVEIVVWMQKNQRLDALAAFLKRLPPDAAADERIRLARAQAAINSGALGLAETLLNYRFAKIREGDLILTELWEKLQIAKAERKLGRPATPAEAKAALAAAPLPIYLDFGV
jgi:Domain of unknown function (DUF5107)